MLSVNNNFSAAIALQSLSKTGAELNEVQTRINTGLKVSSAKDNGAVFAIAQQQRSRSSSLTSVMDGIARATTAIDTGLAAGQSISDLLVQMKEKAVAAQGRDLSTEQRAAINNDFQELLSQVNTIANAATFNGANLVNGTNTAAPLNVMTSDVGRTAPTATVQTLSGVAGGTAGARPSSASGIVGAIGTDNYAAGDRVRFTIGVDGGATSTVDVRITDNMTIAQFVDAVNVQSGGSIQARYNETSGQVQYQVIGQDALVNETIAVAVTDSNGTARSASTFLGGGQTAAAAANFNGGNTFAVAGTDLRLSATANATLGGLTTADALSSADAASAVAAKIDLATKNVSSALASLGSKGKALETQRTFLTKLQDNIDKGVSNLVDADLAKESSRLQALQVRQQLGAQALSIANQSTGLVLSFFR
jgi:flagellin